MTDLTKANFVSEVENYTGLVVIDLWADWCGPCRMLAPTLDELESEYPDVKFGKINVDNEPELARAFKGQSIPFVALVKDNVFLEMSVGYVPKASIARLIEQYK